QTFTLTVNEPAAVASGNAVTFVVGVAGTVTVTATGFPAPTLSALGTLPDGVTFQGGGGSATLTGTPAAGSAGVYPLTITAHNGIGADATQTFTLTVAQTPQAPAITSGSAATFAVGSVGSFSVTATGSPTPTLALTGSLPAGLTFANHGDGTATIG